MSEQSKLVSSDHDQPKSPPRVLSRVPVSTFSWCYCDGAGYTTKHVEIKTHNAEIQPGVAVAVSYGIGDFDRSFQTVGHRENDPSSPVQLVFGREWSLADVVTSLVDLSAQHGAIWFDQLSIPQNPEMIAVHLQSMPEIYRTFEVIILQPNAPCPCLAEAMALYETGKDPQNRVTRPDGDFKLWNSIFMCINAVPLCSYHYRLWTKLEFIHARCISVQYCGPPAGPCSRDTPYLWSDHLRKLSQTQLRYMGTWFTWIYEQYRAEVDQHGEWQDEAAWSLTQQHFDAGIASIRISLMDFYVRKDLDWVETNLGKVIGASLARFILGEKLTRIKEYGDALLSFSDMDSQHVTSVAADYVLAVFPLAKSYSIPHNAANLSVSALLDDAVEQYEHGRGYATGTLLPQGLFSLTETNSIRCKPSLFMPADEKITTLRDIYGCFKPGDFKMITPIGHTLVTFRPSSSTSSHSRLLAAQSYAYVFPEDEPSSTERALRLFQEASVQNYYQFGPDHLRNPLSSWARAVVEGEIAYSREQGDTWPSPAHEKAIFKALLSRDDVPDSWGPLPLIDHEAVTYSLVCDYFCINVDIARERGLGVVVKEATAHGGLPSIGLFNSIVYKGLQDIEEWQRQNGGPPSMAEQRNRNTVLYEDDWLTAGLKGARDDMCWSFECYKYGRKFKLDGIDVPMYRAVGVWIRGLKNDNSIGADLTAVWDDAGAVLL